MNKELTPVTMKENQEISYIVFTLTVWKIAVFFIMLWASHGLKWWKKEDDSPCKVLRGLNTSVPFCLSTYGTHTHIHTLQARSVVIYTGLVLVCVRVVQYRSHPKCMHTIYCNMESAVLLNSVLPGKVTIFIWLKTHHWVMWFLHVCLFVCLYERNRSSNKS